MSTPAPSEPDAASVKKPRSNRNVVRATNQQRTLLQQAFRQCNDPPVGEAMKLLAAETGLTEKWIKDWFRRENKRNRVAVKQEVEDSSPERLALSEPEAEVMLTSQAQSDPRPKKKARLLPAPLFDNTIVIKREYSDPSLQVNSPLPEKPIVQSPSDALVLPHSGDVVTTVSSYQKHASKRRGRRKKPSAVSAHALNSQINASPIPAEENSDVTHDQVFSTQGSISSPSEPLVVANSSNSNTNTGDTTPLPKIQPIPVPHIIVPHVAAPPHFANLHPQVPQAGIHFQRRLNPVANYPGSSRPIFVNSTGVSHTVTKPTQRAPSNFIQSISPRLSSSTRVRASRYSDMMVSLPSTATSHTSSQIENHPVLPIPQYSGGQRPLFRPLPIPQPQSYSLPTPMNGQVTPMKHLTVLESKFKNHTSPVPGEKIRECLLDEELTKKDPFQAAMGLVFLNRSGLCCL